MIKSFNSIISGAKSDIALKHRPDRFPSVGDHFHVTRTFEHAWATPSHTVIGGS